MLTLPYLELATILVLLAVSCPSHVARFIAAQIIDAVNRMFVRWLRTDVGKEGREVVAPFITHSDAATAPMFVVAITRVVATSLDVCPRTILGAVGFAVLRKRFNCFFSAQTPTTFSATFAQTSTVGAGNAATITQAIPTDCAAFVFGARYYSQSPKSLPDKVARHFHCVSFYEMNYA